MIQEINKNVFIYINSLNNYDFIEKLSPLFADLPIFFLPLFLIYIWLKNSKGKIKGQNNKKENLLFIFYSTIIAVLINYIIKLFFDVDRPEEYLEIAGQLILNSIPDKSFPSDHSAVSVAFLTSLFLFNYKKIAYIFLPFVILMLISRIIIGVHWPLDIIAGTVVGISSSFIVFKLLIKNKLVKKLNLFIIKILSFIKL